MIHLGLINFITYFFLTSTVIMGGMMVVKKHPVHAVLSLIATFCSGGVLILINNAEFLAFVILTVYVGAVMVLFLFVVMMVDVDSIVYTKNHWCEKLSIGIVSLVMFSFLYNAIQDEISAKKNQISVATELSMTSETIMPNQNQAKEIGKLIYSEENSIYIIIASLILLVGIIGAIILTLREKEGLKKQDLFEQLLRSPENTLEIKKVPCGAGVNDE